ncbi:MULTISPECIES: nitrophenyl compound nitroreductase subunit ArsF family protein [unclassified Carboxylicivirga]|uniref:nitrophenyl compound nitroreductase subunit ArsF family protein n=1 Tax=Carboxylicivirga TaxID=1628153 RepID=UPI003D34C97F
MNKLIYAFLMLAGMTLAASCNSSTKNNKEKTVSKTETACSGCASQSCGSSTPTTPSIDASKVSVVYFHATRRCATCEAVEKVSKETLAKYFNDSVPFHSINREEEKELAKKYKVDGQTLIIIKGDKVKSLTNEAFLNARTKPEKLEATIKETIESMS